MYLQPDPYGLWSGDLTQYAYGASDPLSKTDRTGEYACVEVLNDRDFVVVIPIRWDTWAVKDKGCAGSAIKKFTESIQSLWTGRVGGKNVLVVVESSYGKGRSWFGQSNYVRLTPGKLVRSEGSRARADAENFPVGAEGWVAAHEAGHHMGLQHNRNSPEDLMTSGTNSSTVTDELRGSILVGNDELEFRPGWGSCR